MTAIGKLWIIAGSITSKYLNRGELQVPDEHNTPAEDTQEEYVLVNAYEEMVRANVRELMVKMDMCQCQKCFLDACALVCNRQYTRFVTTRKGALMTKLPEMNHGSQAEMTVIILEALRMVKESPMH